MTYVVEESVKLTNLDTNLLWCGGIQSVYETCLERKDLVKGDEEQNCHDYQNSR